MLTIFQGGIFLQGKERHIFPGSNTPVGFFSYYDYILDQNEADRIICLKGGPGVGKSTFMKITAYEMIDKGYDVDFMHCSSDNNSIDGIVIKGLKVAFIDGTAPHVVDPKNPGAVDMIVNLGDFWNEDGIRENREEVLRNNLEIKFNFEKAYNFFGAAKRMYDNMNSVYEHALEEVEIYKEAARIVNQELSHKEISKKKGRLKKYFASAFTPKGTINYIDSLIKDYEKIYIIKAPVGIGGERILDIIQESARYRGLDVEQYYCPMVPDKKIEHLLIPAVNTAFVTSNHYHKVKTEAFEVININHYICWKCIKAYKGMMEESKRLMEELINLGIGCIKTAKTIHDTLETHYIPNMNFKAVEECRRNLIRDYILKEK